MKLAIYGHGGSENHGNEAIVRGVRELFPNAELILYSFSPKVDKKFHLDKVCTIKPIVQTNETSYIKRVIFKFLKKYCSRTSWYYHFWFSPFLNDISKDVIYLLEAGDQYCEKGDHRLFYSYLNKQIRKKGAKTVLMGCSINPELLKDRSVVKDIKNYSLIIARESITYKALKLAGIRNNLKLASCPAFAMKHECLELPSIFYKGEVIGINFGFLSQGNEIYYKNMMENYDNAVDYILKETDYDIALIPHVNWTYNYSDLKSLRIIYKKYSHTNRIALIAEHNAPQQKFIMSKCKIMIALRTHVAIPSIESMVPTIITGYKVKSLGFYKDIYKDDMKTLVHVQNMEHTDNIVEAFRWLIDNYTLVQEYMSIKMPKYLKKLSIIQDSITDLYYSDN